VRAKVAIAIEASNPGGAVLGIENPDAGIIQKAINDVLRANFGKKAWAYLAVLIRLQQRGISDRVAKHRIAGTRPYDLVDITLLLGSELGNQVEKAMLKAADLDPSWFRDRERAVKTINLKAELQQLEFDRQAEEERQIATEISRRKKR
jgi:hypothetical protein